MFPNNVALIVFPNSVPYQCSLYPITFDTRLTGHRSSRAHWDAHMVTPHVAKGNEALAGLLREPTELRFYSAK